MKKISNISKALLIGLLTFGLGACNFNGFGDSGSASYIQGPEGPQGPQGPQGEQGIPGKDGTSVLTGYGAPSSYIGRNGDSYIDLSNWDFYIKEGGVWVLVGNIKGQGAQNGETGPQGPQGEQGEQGETGPQGPQGDKGDQGDKGADGTSMLTGYGAPAPDLGQVGDSYINLNNWDLYVKDVDGWQLIGNIKSDANTGPQGPQGDKGDQGDQGEQGPQGDKGDTGEDGTSVLTGYGVPSEQDGKDGDSYIDLSTWDFYVKVDGIWVLKGNIKGEDGVSDEPEIHIVTFETNGGTEVNTQYVKHGEKIKKPHNPEKVGSDFVNWTYEDEVWSFTGYVVTEDMTLTAQWDEIEYTVTFYNDDGTVLDYQEGLHYGDHVAYGGETPIKQNVEERYSYEFLDWGKELIVTGDMEFYACYSQKYLPYTVIYLDYDGTELFRKYVAEKETGVYEGKIPTRESTDSLQYSFKEWEKISEEGEYITYKATYSEATLGLIINGNLVQGYNGNSSEVTIPSFWNGNYVDAVDSHCFAYNNTITKVTIQPGISRLEYRAFENCPNLVEIDNKSCITSIGDACFSDCFNLKTADVLQYIEVINSYVFYGCHSLEKITLAENVKQISYGAFDQCYSIEHITLSENIEYIDNYAFAACQNLTYVYIPSSVQNVASAAFENSLKANIFTDATEAKPNWEFLNNQNTGAIYFGSNNAEIKKEDIYEYAVVENGEAIAITGILDESNIIDIPERLAGMEVKYVSASAINKHISYQNTTLKEIDIPENVILGGKFPRFENFTFLEKVSIPLGVNKVDSYSFARCYALKEVAIKEATTIEYAAFESCGLLEKVTLNDELKEIGNSAFMNCQSLEIINIPESLNYIGYNAFTNCSSLKNITIPEGIERLESQTFSDCISLETVVLPDSLKEIGTSCFAWCRSLTSIDLKNVEIINEAAFETCMSLSRVVSNEKIHIIEYHAFYNTGITSIVLPLSAEFIGYEVLSNTNNEHINIFSYNYPWPENWDPNFCIGSYRIYWYAEWGFQGGYNPYPMV